MGKQKASISAYFPEVSLTLLSASLSRGKAPRPLLGQVLDGLARLPPEAVNPAEHWIPNLAGLQRPSWWGLSDHDISFGHWRHLLLLKRERRLVWLFLFHRDGHVRQASLERLDAPPDAPFFLASLALRLNDWVAPVRRAALCSAERWFPKVSPAVAVGAAAFLLDRRLRWERWTETEAAPIDELYGRPDVAAALATHLMTSATGSLANELRMALRRPALEPHLVCLVRRAVQPAVRAAALQTLLRGHVSWPIGFEREWVDKRFGISRRITRFAQRPLAVAIDIDPLVFEGLRDRSPLVRRVAADALIERRSKFKNLEGALQLLANDPSQAIRERADFLVRHALASRDPTASQI